MSDTVSVPKRLYKDKRLKDFDIRLYLTIIEHVNDFGYSKISNDTLAYKTGKQERAIQRALNSLVKYEYIQVKLKVKKNELYDDSVSRVIWRIEKYREHHWNIGRPKQVKSKNNDFNLFRAFLYSDCKGLAFPIDMGGLVQVYKIHDNNLLYVHPTGEAPRLLDPHDSMDCYKRMFKNRKAIFAHVTGMEESLSMQELAKKANQKGEN